MAPERSQSSVTNGLPSSIQFQVRGRLMLPGDPHVGLLSSHSRSFLRKEVVPNSRGADAVDGVRTVDTSPSAFLLLVKRELNIVFGICGSSRSTLFSRSLDETLDASFRLYVWALPLRFLLCLVRFLVTIVGYLQHYAGCKVGRSDAGDDKDSGLQGNPEEHQLSRKDTGEGKDYGFSPVSPAPQPRSSISASPQGDLQRTSAVTSRCVGDQALVYPRWYTGRRHLLVWHPRSPAVVYWGVASSVPANQDSVPPASGLVVYHIPSRRGTVDGLEYAYRGVGAPETRIFDRVTMHNPPGSSQLRVAPSRNRQTPSRTQRAGEASSAQAYRLDGVNNGDAVHYVPALASPLEDVLCVALSSGGLTFSVALGTGNGLWVWSTSSLPLCNEQDTVQAAHAFGCASPLHRSPKRECTLAGAQCASPSKDARSFSSERLDLLFPQRLRGVPITAVAWLTDSRRLVAFASGNSYTTMAVLERVYVPSTGKSVSRVWRSTIVVDLSSVLSLPRVPSAPRWLRSRSIIAASMCSFRPLLACVSSASEILLFETQSWTYRCFSLAHAAPRTSHKAATFSDPIPKIEWLPASTGVSGFLCGINHCLFQCIVAPGQSKLDSVVSMSVLEFDLPSRIVAADQPVELVDFSVEPVTGTRLALVLENVPFVLFYRYYSHTVTTYTLCQRESSPFTSFEGALSYQQCFSKQAVSRVAACHIGSSPLCGEAPATPLYAPRTVRFAPQAMPSDGAAESTDSAGPLTYTASINEVASRHISTSQTWIAVGWQASQRTTCVEHFSPSEAQDAARLMESKQSSDVHPLEYTFCTLSESCPL